MSDTQGDRPAESTPESSTPAAQTPLKQSPAQPAEPTSVQPDAAAALVHPAEPTSAAQPATPVQPAPPAAPVLPATAAPAAAVTPTAAAPAAAPAAPVAGPPQQSPVQPAQPAAPTQPAAHGWHAPHQGNAPAGYPAYPQQGQPYAGPRPQGYAGQPAPAPQYASAFGASAGPRPELNQTQPTLPLGHAATGTVPVASAPKKKSSAGKMVGFIVAAAIVSGAAGLGGAYVGANLFTPAGSLPAAGPSTITVNNTESVNQTTAISAKVLPSVVTISASSGSAGGTGSGVILSADGYVVTNTHVVTLDGAAANATIRVTTSDGKVYDATIVGTDPTYDLAVIKLTDASGLTPIDFADSSKLNVGDQTIAIGAPLGLSNTVTTGIVSALNRSIQIASSAAPDSSDTQGDSGNQGQGQESPFQFDFGQGQSQSTTPTQSISIAVIQTDAAINPGNSGGALIDAEGKLIGINVAIATASGSSGQSGSIGVGFSIPSNIVERVTGEIIDSGKATHGLLGASVQDAASVADSTITGAYIAEATDGGAAAKGGLQKGDIVTAFNGVPVTNATDLTAQVRAAAAGSDAKVTFVRDGKTQTTEVTLGTLSQ